MSDNARLDHDIRGTSHPPKSQAAEGCKTYQLISGYRRWQALREAVTQHSNKNNKSNK
jgi:hypothetical protein